METIELNIGEITKLHHLIYGLPDGSRKGFLAEEGPTEGTKRILNKAGKLLTASIEAFIKQRDEIVTQFQKSQKQEIENVKALKLDAEHENEKIDEINKIYNEKIGKALTELAEPKEKFQVQKLDFSKVESFSFKDDYTFLYEILFS